MLIKMFLFGWLLLVGAILVNIIAIKLGVETWYSFLNNIGKYGFVKAFTDASIASKIYLLIIYPLSLGFLMLIISKLK